MNSANPTKSTVYVIDDDEDFGKALQRFLLSEGYNVESFPSARSFLDSVPSSATGCAVSDVYMPDVDGFELHRLMRERHYTLPMIFISAHADASDRESALEQGAAGFSTKPYDEKYLLGLIRRALHQ